MNENQNDDASPVQVSGAKQVAPRWSWSTLGWRFGDVSTPGSRGVLGKFQLGGSLSISDGAGPDHRLLEAVYPTFTLACMERDPYM